MSMGLKFNEKKATQAASVILELAEGSLNYMVLLKDLYLSDRKSLIERGCPITNDKYYSMKCGPVLSNVLSLINEEPMPGEISYWHEFISPPSDYEVKLKGSPGASHLSVAEEELIGKIFREYEDYQRDPFVFVDFLHACLPEYEQVDEGRIPIYLRSILMADRKTADEINEILEELRSVSFVHSMYGAEA